MFGETETIEDGLGPLFNGSGCGECHSTPVIGGSGEQIERRFGLLDAGVFFGYDSPEGGRDEDSDRRTTPLFGLGLVDAMPDRWFERLASRQRRSVRGTVSYVRVALPDPRDPRQRIGSRRVGRFGWKGNVPTLIQFSADAYANEMGITTQSCFRGETILDFASEPFPNNIAPPEGCNGGDLAPAQAAHQDVPEFADDVVGGCGSDLTEIQDDVVAFAMFMESLAPTPRDFRNRDQLRRGGAIFARTGCADCHVSTTFVTPRRPFNDVPGNYEFNPYSDFLLHDMGSLGDGIGNTGDPEAATRLMRTAPLWGARFNTSFLHDGRALDVESAIEEHDGQGASSRERFQRLRERDRQALISFVLSL